MHSQQVPDTALLTVVFPLTISELCEIDKNLSFGFFFPAEELIYKPIHPPSTALQIRK